MAYVDLLGTTYSASTLATGYGAYIALPLLRKAVEGREEILTEVEAQKIIEESMRVLFYRDARSLNKASFPSQSYLSRVTLRLGAARFPDPDVMAYSCLLHSIKSQGSRRPESTSLMPSR